MDLGDDSWFLMLVSVYFILINTLLELVDLQRFRPKFRAFHSIMQQNPLSMGRKTQPINQPTNQLSRKINTLPRID